MLLLVRVVDVLVGDDDKNGDESGDDDADDEDGEAGLANNPKFPKRCIMFMVDNAVW